MPKNDILSYLLPRVPRSLPFLVQYERFSVSGFSGVTWSEHLTCFWMYFNTNVTPILALVDSRLILSLPVTFSALPKTFHFCRDNFFLISVKSPCLTFLAWKWEEDIVVNCFFLSTVMLFVYKKKCHLLYCICRQCDYQFSWRTILYPRPPVHHLFQRLFNHENISFNISVFDIFRAISLNCQRSSLLVYHCSLLMYLSNRYDAFKFCPAHYMSHEYLVSFRIYRNYYIQIFELFARIWTLTSLEDSDFPRVTLETPILMI